MATHVMEGQAARREVYYPAAIAGIDWRAVFAGALAGFAVTLILTTLGAAIGITAADAADRGNAATIGTGAGIWWLITALVAGIIGGSVVARTAYRGPAYSPVLYGTLVWVVGAIILLLLLAIGVGNVMGGLGAGMSVAAQRGSAGMTPADSVRATQQAAEVGAGAAWGLFISQIVAVGASIFGAARRRPAEQRRVEA